MNEQLKEVLSFANENPSGWFATSEDNQPSVRGLYMWFADETGFYFHTAKAKKLYHQIKNNPLVEVAFMRNANDPVNFESLRVTGEVEEVFDKELEKKLFAEREWLWGNIERSGVDTEVVIFRIVRGSAYIWSMACNIKEEAAARVNF